MKKEALPAKLPRIVLPLFQTFGDTLRDDEYLSVSTGVDKKRAARFDKRIKERILRWATKTYPDAIDLTGEVRSTDLDGRRFTLRLPDGRKVPGYFDPDHEAVVLEALGEHSSRRLRVIGTGEFAPEDGSLQQILSVERIELIGPEAAPPTVPIWERFASIAASVPDEAWREVPSNLSSQVDRYLYGRKNSR